MGIYDSSRTRVAPVFGRLQCFDPSGRLWIQAILELAASQRQPRPQAGTSPLRLARWWPKVARLPAAPLLLEWLLRNPREPESARAWGRREVREKRRRLVDRDAATLEEALERIGRQPSSARAWYVLEGPSEPDVYLETDEVVVIVEGKRTEPGPAISTGWMPMRHQMLRHLDAAWEHLRERRLYGLFIVEADEAGEKGEPPAAWRMAVDASVSDEALEQSLPHRAPDQRSAIAAALLGVTTWQAVCDELQIPSQVLIPEVLDPTPERRPRRRSSGATTTVPGLMAREDDVAAPAEPS